MMPRAALAVAVVVVVAVTGLVPGCGGPDAGKRERPPVPVTVVDARAQALPIEVSAVGTVVPLATVAVQPRLSGQITRIAFKEGDMVDKGALLFEIDSSAYVAALAQAQAALARDIAQAENADAELARVQLLLERQLTSPQEAGQKSSQAKALHATVAADQAAVDNAKLNLSWTRVTSPVAGRADRRLVDVGNNVTPASGPVVTVRQLRPIQVSFALPQERVLDVQRRMKAGALAVKASLPEHSDVVETGALTLIGGAVDPSTGTVSCKADFENSDEALWPGAYVRVLLTLGTVDAVVVPSGVVQTGQQGPFVYVVRDGAVELRPVTTGASSGGVVAVEGVAAGETVVVDGQMALIPGSKVVVKPPVTGAAPGPPAPPTGGRG